MYTRAMPRAIPETRFDALIDAATRVFIAQGYRRTQMADVAEALGVAKGTLYLCVDSKEALFDAAVRHADAPRPIPLPRVLPISAPGPGRTLAYVRERLAREPVSPTLRAVLARARTRGGPDRLERILEEIFDAMARNRTGIKLLDRCAVDHPDLAEIWFAHGRRALLAELSAYLEARTGAGQRRRDFDVAVVARFVLETLVFWAVHRHWDPAPQPVDASVARRTVVRMLMLALTNRAEGARRRDRR
jgi:AcrR family transcriptional regulator